MKRVLRMDPDVILLGEMRDLETISTAITAAETGHLVLGTLHTTGSARTIDRIIDAFPSDQQEQCRAQLSVALLAVISQVIMGRADKDGLVAGFEVMIMNSAIENLVRKNETFKIRSVLQTHKTSGMVMLDESLWDLYKAGKITAETMLLKCQDQKEIQRKLDFDDLGGGGGGGGGGSAASPGGGSSSGAAGGASPAACVRRLQAHVHLPAEEPAVGMPMPPRKQLLGQVLKSLGIGIHEGMIQEALAVQRAEGGQIGHILVGLGHVTEAQLLLALGKQAGLEVVDFRKTPPDPALVARIDPMSAEMFCVCPVRMDGDVMIIALADPTNISILDELRFLLNCELRAAMADADQIKARAQGRGRAGDDARQRAAAEAQEDEASANAAPVVKLLNFVILQAVKDKASDIHLEPFEKDFKIRYRVDGVLYELEPPPQHLAVPLISRVKVMAGMDIAETRLPQDGRIDMTIQGRSVDLRVSTLPTMFGESCVLRILDRTVVALDLSQVGLRPDELATFRGFLQRPHGIILVTGPTGSGKTTTLYSALNEANDPAVKIITTEDPVEYDLAGIIQVQVNEEIGVTYGKCLRAILRQDPDMILVGEIRDRETAGIAIEAALTGHVVLSTVHTNDAPLAVTRMVDIGVESFLLAATLEAIVAQRLVRRVCTGCKVWYDPSDEVLMELGLRASDVQGKQFAHGKGCDNCHFTGFRGRTALFEILTLSDRIREMIMDGSATDAIRSAAKEQGMRSLRDSGLLSIFDGVTTVEEVLRETMEVF